MRAVIHDRYGSVDDLYVGEVPEPSPRDDEVLVRVHASSTHADVWHVVTGHPRLLRVMGNGLRRPRHRVPGTDVAGVVEAIGASVTSVAVGDEVIAETLRGIQWVSGGAWAELATAPIARVAPKPEGLSMVEAACLPTVGLIALDLLFGQGDLESGERLLVNGAGGAVGTLMVQVAKAHGAHVTAVDNATKATLLRELGADVVLDHEVDDFTARGEHWDVIVDLPGNHAWRRVRPRLTPRGRYVPVGHDGFDTSRHRLIGSLSWIAPLMLRAIWSPHLKGVTRHAPYEQRMRQLVNLSDAGELRPIVERTYPLDQASTALRHLASGATTGRLVLTPD